MIFAIIALAMVGCGNDKATDTGKVTCKSFNTQRDAQAYFDEKKPNYLELDTDKDGTACEEKKRRKKKRRKKRKRR